MCTTFGMVYLLLGFVFGIWESVHQIVGVFGAGTVYLLFVGVVGMIMMI